MYRIPEKNEYLGYKICLPLVSDTVNIGYSYTDEQKEVRLITFRVPIESFDKTGYSKLKCLKFVQKAGIRDHLDLQWVLDAAVKEVEDE